MRGEGGVDWIGSGQKSAHFIWLPQFHSDVIYFLVLKFDSRFSLGEYQFWFSFDTANSPEY